MLTFHDSARFRISSAGLKQAVHPQPVLCCCLAANCCVPQEKNQPDGLTGVRRRFVKFGGGVSEQQLQWLEDQLQVSCTAGMRTAVQCAQKHSVQQQQQPAGCQRSHAGNRQHSSSGVIPSTDSRAGCCVAPVFVLVPAGSGAAGAAGGGVLPPPHLSRHLPANLPGVEL